MVRGWYTGASGMNAQQNRLDVISNNLANVDTTGYKRDVAVSKNFSELLLRRMNDDGVYKIPFGSADASPIIGKVGLGVETNESFTIHEQGSFKQTSNNPDMALQGEGFFAVNTPQGERYTRNGNFLVGREGILETKEGLPVLGENGLIFVDDRDFKVNIDGIITFTDTGEVADRLKLVRFDNERYLQKQGSSLYGATETSGEAFIAEDNLRPGIIQGYVETANVNVVTEMVQMIEVNRAYEANQKSIQTQDTMMTSLWSKVALMR
ncbi:MAG: flagellar basal-body rod protein FlgF [Treponemataceae bacterium]